MNAARWLQHFQTNREKRSEPDWKLPHALGPDTVKVLGRSLAHFQLGESGEGRQLLRGARRVARLEREPDYYEAMQLFIGEEKEHARLLAKLAERYQTPLLHRHWTHSMFRFVRRMSGLEFELKVLVVAELIGSAYYHLLLLRTPDPVLQEACRIFLRDEVHHLAFHQDRLAWHLNQSLPCWRTFWMLRLQFILALSMRAAWMDHGSCLRVVGTSRREFYSLTLRYLNRFTAGLARKTALEPFPVPGVPI